MLMLMLIAFGSTDSTGSFLRQTLSSVEPTSNLIHGTSGS